VEGCAGEGSVWRSSARKEVGEVPQGSMVLRKVKTRPGVGRRGLASGRSSRPRKAIGGRGVEQRAGVRRS
jgi:hypothetical protein